MLETKCPDVSTCAVKRNYRGNDLQIFYRDITEQAGCQPSGRG